MSQKIPFLQMFAALRQWTELSSAVEGWLIASAAIDKASRSAKIAVEGAAGAGPNLIALANEVEERLKTVDKPITVAVMGCAVNGPGEARSADCGIAGGIGEGLLFQKGEIVKKVPQDRLVDELFQLIERL